LLSNRYCNDGRAVTALTTSQTIAWRRFFAAVNSGKLTRSHLDCCPQCGSLERVIVAQKDRYGDNVISALCKGCGLFYSVNPFDEVSTSHFYRDYYRDLYTKSVDRAESIERQYAKALNRLDFYAGALQAAGFECEKDLLVELGCGAGWSLAAFQACGARVIGLDYDKEFLAIGRAKGLDLRDLNEAPAIVHVRDAAMVVAREVIEHTSDPYSFLAEANALLRPGGYLLLTTPPLEEIPFGYASGRVLGTLQNAHYFLFDRQTLGTYLAQAGFDVVIMTPSLRVLARKVAVPVRCPTSILGNFERNLRLLTLSEHTLQYYWRSIEKLAGTMGFSREHIYALRQAHWTLFAERRRALPLLRYVNI